jgi:hypothetical protein
MGLNVNPKRKLKTLSILTVLLVSTSFGLYSFQGIKASYTYQNNFETGIQEMTGSYTAETGTIQLSTTHPHSGVYSVYSTTASEALSQGFCYQTLVSSYSSLYFQCYAYWTTGPASGNIQGLPIGGLANVTTGCHVEPIVYNNGSSYVWGVRRCNMAGSWGNIYSSIVSPINTYTCVELAFNTSGYSLYVNGVYACGEAVSLEQMKYVYAGITHCNNQAMAVYVDDIVVSTSYIGTSKTPASYYYSSYTPLYSNSSWAIQYPCVLDGYLWTVLSHNSSGDVVGAIIVKRNVTTGAVLNERYLDNIEFETFTVTTYHGLVFIPAISLNGTAGQGSITILNETTLADVLFLTFPSTVVNCFTTAAVDESRGLLIIGAGMNNNSLSIVKCPLAQVLNASAYSFVNIGTNPFGGTNGDETQAVIFNGLVYVSAVCPCSNAGTRESICYLYSSNDLSSWSTVWQKGGWNAAGSTYFAHISATDDCLAVGILCNDTTGITTYRIEYTSLAGPWKEYNTFSRNLENECHPQVNAASDDIFIFEPTTRYYQNYHSVSAFNATSGELTFLFSLAGSRGANDRWIGIDAVNGNIYIADYEYQTPPRTSRIVKIAWNLPLGQPPYYGDTPQPTPPPTPTRTPWQNFFLNQSNFMTFLAIPCVAVIGNLFYALILFTVGMSVYIHYRNISVVTLLIVLFAGTGGVINLTVGDAYIGVVWLICTFGLGLAYWRVFH